MPQDRGEWLKAVTCPRCGDWCEPTGRAFRFGVFDGRTYFCEGCGKHFNAFYRDAAFRHTVPRARVELREIAHGEAEKTSESAESTDVAPTEYGRVRNISCPRCGGAARPTGRTFKFGVFNGKSFYCEQCEKHFNAFYRTDVLSHTVPVGGVEIIEEAAEEIEQETPEIGEEFAETPPVPQEPEPGPDVQGEEPEAEEASSAFVEEAVSPASAGVGAEDAASYTIDEVVGFMRGLREDVERLQVLNRDEEEVVGEFSRALLGATSPLSLALPVDASLLPPEMGDIERASVAPNGVLVLLMRDGTMETVNLVEQENRDLLVTVVRDALPQYKALLQGRRKKIEQRIALLSKATKDLREVAEYIAGFKR